MKLPLTLVMSMPENDVCVPPEPESPGDQPDQPPVRFVVDVMLGSLARWLRRLGYDTDYASTRDDAELVRIARAEQRVLLTRDRPLAQRRGLRALWIASQSLDEQLRQVTTAFPLTPDRCRPRCAECNSLLLSAEPSEVADRVPAYVLGQYQHFQRCPNCGRVYWPGSHWSGIQSRLRPHRS